MKYAKTLFIGTALCASAIALAAPQIPPVNKPNDIQAISAVSAVAFPTTIVELFTSQGCSSCPPANKFVIGLGGTEDLLTLSYSVDYWDYLGWKDTHGKPEFSKRQRQYGQQFQGQVYTPQIVVNGASHAARFAKQDVREHVLDGSGLKLALNETEKGVAVTLKGPAAVLTEIRYTPGVQSVSISRGENRGRTISLSNIVTSSIMIGQSDDQQEFSTVLEKPEAGQAVAIIVQDGIGGPIVSAATYLP